MADDIEIKSADIATDEQSLLATGQATDEIIDQATEQMVISTTTTATISTDTTIDHLIENHSDVRVNSSVKIEEKVMEKATIAENVEKEAGNDELVGNDELLGNDELVGNDELLGNDELVGDADGDIDMLSEHPEYSDEGSEYEPDAETPPPPVKSARQKNSQPKSPNSVKRTPGPNPGFEQASPNVTPDNREGLAKIENLQTPMVVGGPKIPKTPASRVRTGRVEKSGSTPGSGTNLRCPVKGCGQTFTGRNPRQSLWHHLKYYATRGLPDRAEFERSHGEAHSEMKREAEPKGTPVERNRISSSDYRKKNPEKAKTSARLSNFRARARKKGLTDEREIEEHVVKWEKEWQEKQAKEASEYFSGILLSAFE